MLIDSSRNLSIREGRSDVVAYCPSTLTRSHAVFDPCVLEFLHKILSPDHLMDVVFVEPENEVQYRGRVANVCVREDAQERHPV